MESRPSCLVVSDHHTPGLNQIIEFLDNRYVGSSFLYDLLLEDLQHGLQFAVEEIFEKVDRDLGEYIDRMQDAQHRFDLDVRDFWEPRRIDVDELDNNNQAAIQAMGRGQLIANLIEAQREIYWARHEMRRMDMYMANARAALRAGTRTSFHYRPLQRSGEW